MDESVHERLVAMMRAMAGGDGAAPFALVAEFGSAIGACLRHHLRYLGMTFVDQAELDGLVLDAVFELRLVAAGWDPAKGALPWVWARDRMVRLACRYVGIHTEALDPARHEQWLEGDAGLDEGGDERDEVAVLARLAGVRPECRLLLEALDRVAPARNQEILLGVRVQASLGDPSPSVTIGREVGMKPDAIRQVVHRTRRALIELAGADPRFAPLVELAIVA